MSATPGTAIDVERRAALNGAKLSGLVAGQWGPGDRRRGALGATATLVEVTETAPTGPGGSAPGVSGWLMPDGDAARAFARVNSIDRHVVESARATVGIVTCGKAHLDLLVNERSVREVEDGAVVAAGRAGQLKDGRRILFFATERGARPDLGIKAKVTSVVPRIDRDGAEALWALVRDRFWPPPAAGPAGLR